MKKINIHAEIKKKGVENMKTKEEILNQIYITSNDLKLLVPTLGKGRCIEIVKELRNDMEKEGMYVPKSKPLLASVKVFKKKFKI